jgi:hypothetical protein
MPIVMDLEQAMNEPATMLELDDASLLICLAEPK